MSCNSNEDLYGGRCYMQKCPSGSHRSAVSTCDFTFDWRGNTHQRIVNQAIDMLATKGTNDTVAAVVIERMRLDTECEKKWREGLWDADGPELKDTKKRGTHFWNAHKGGDGGIGPRNARSIAQAHIDNAKTISTNDECYELGLALHYMTDLTQPMHAVNFTGVDLPSMLHPTWEDYVPRIQANSTAVSWDGNWTNKTPDEVLGEAARRAAPYWSDKNGNNGTLKNALLGNGGACTITPEGGWSYTGYCFPGDETVDKVTGEILQDAYNSTASYLYAVFRMRDETPLQREDPNALPAANLPAPASAASSTSILSGEGEDTAPAAPSPVPAITAAPAPATLAPVPAITVQVGDTLWAISRERYGDGLLYFQVFEANRDAIRNPDLIYPGQVFTLPEK